MPKFRFTKDFDFKPSSQATVGYKAGWEGRITKAAADAALAAKAGEVIEAEDASVTAEPARAKPSKAAQANG